MSRLRSPTLLSYSLRSQTVGLNKAHTETPRDLLAFVPRCKIGWGVAGLTPYEEWLVTEAWGPESLAPSENKQTKIRYGLWWHSYNLSAGEEGAKVFFLASQSSESVMSRFSERLWLKKKNPSKMENRRGRLRKMLTSGLWTQPCVWTRTHMCTSKQPFHVFHDLHILLFLSFIDTFWKNVLESRWKHHMSFC